jgi:hypothetical protein
MIKHFKKLKKKSNLIGDRSLTSHEIKLTLNRLYSPHFKKLKQNKKKLVLI